MPPKQDNANQKSLEKAKQKILEDKTFGLKNKNKSKAVQKHIKGLQQQITGKPAPDSAKWQSQLHKEKEEKKKQEQHKALIQSLFRDTKDIKNLSKNAAKQTYDPKKSRMDQKIDYYIDQRLQKQSDSSMSTELSFETDIVCKHFTEAIKSNKYGWFWVCPNGGDDCKYRHSLPKDYVFPDEQEVVEEVNETLEDKIDRERHELVTNGELLTLDVFLRWKEGKSSGKDDSATKLTTGKDLYILDPSLFMDDDKAVDGLGYGENANFDEFAAESQDGLDAVACGPINADLFTSFEGMSLEE
ncbi:Zinc finger CCCH domain-containing protein 11 [Babesia microti strain RI]|uniref:Zinc finger CCCH domain-containing protein 11 n=1 Tax=Babesia microti (strain RI) TaxID=1133968 RepID=A0A1R4ABK9_BABMR|nr:Zinc finger CCCH domain-containing protein 11 [Babesia microti strain RI]SJK86399.1 Zinc finger CCCH domain-containing protein 11 [Babesia microti strain RI]|eukprot:XP_021338560.1 Zinc finger CCCH domain-containing protein 11 [Babesia microti strain RI]